MNEITKGSQKQIEWAKNIQQELVAHIANENNSSYWCERVWKLFFAPGNENQQIRDQFFNELEKNPIREIHLKYKALRKTAKSKEEKKMLKEAKEKELAEFKLNFAQKYLNLFFETPQAKDSKFYIDNVRQLLV